MLEEPLKGKEFYLLAWLGKPLDFSMEFLPEIDTKAICSLDEKTVSENAVLMFVLVCGRLIRCQQERLFRQLLHIFLLNSPYKRVTWAKKCDSPIFLMFFPWCVPSCTLAYTNSCPFLKSSPRSFTARIHFLSTHSLTQLVRQLYWNSRRNGKPTFTLPLILPLLINGDAISQIWSFISWKTRWRKEFAPSNSLTSYNAPDPRFLAHGALPPPLPQLEKLRM